MSFTALHLLRSDRERDARLDGTAALLEERHGALEHTVRLMNLPSWAGYLDLVLVCHGPLPEDLNQAHAGRLLAPSAAVNMLATLIDEGPGDREELQRRMKRDGNRLCPVNCRQLLDAGYIRSDPKTGVVSAHPGIHTGMATVQVHQLDQPTQTEFNSIAQLAHGLHWQGELLTKESHRPTGTAAYLNALGRALEAAGDGEHPDAGPADPIRPGWKNAINIR